ncbi:MAG: OmpH family outer membrane protein [Oligoflexales bacterium]|nr:OmpH family outer membrane protein [Oligoflexales bacterium]
MTRHLIFIALSGIMALVAFSEAFAASGVGVIDMQKVILSVEEGKQARAELEKVIKSKEGEFIKQKQELDRMNKEWQDQSALLSEEARMSKQREFQEKFMQMRNAEMAFQNEIKQKEQKATQEIAVKASKIIQGIAEKKKLQMVFESHSAGLVYVSKPVDLTEDVIAAYGKPGKMSKK